MILKLCTGCLSDSMTIDGTEEVDLSNELRSIAINKIADYLINKLSNNNINGEENYDLISILFDEDADETGRRVNNKDLINLKSRPDLLNYLLQWFIPEYGVITYKSDEPCECCGDWVNEWTMVLPDD